MGQGDERLPERLNRVPHFIFIYVRQELDECLISSLMFNGEMVNLITSAAKTVRTAFRQHCLESAGQNHVRLHGIPSILFHRAYENAVIKKIK